MDTLKLLIRELIKEISEDSDSDKDLLTEPDAISDENEENEVSVVANIAGATTPLGTGPTYPNTPKKKKKTRLPVENEDWYKN